MQRREFVKKSLLAIGSAVFAPAFSSVGGAEERKGFLFLPLQVSKGFQDHLLCHFSPRALGEVVDFVLASRCENMGVQIRLAPPNRKYPWRADNEPFRFGMRHYPLFTKNDIWEFLAPLTIIANFVGPDEKMSFVAPGRFSINRNHPEVQKCLKYGDLLWKSDHPSDLQIMIGTFLNQAFFSEKVEDAFAMGGWDGTKEDLERCLCNESRYNKVLTQEAEYFGRDPLKFSSIWA